MEASVYLIQNIQPLFCELTELKIDKKAIQK